MLNRRLQVLVDDARFERLTEESKRSGAPVGELVRRAIDREFPATGAEREQAGRDLLSLAAPSGEGPEPAWEDQKRDLLDSPAQRWPGA